MRSGTIAVAGVLALGGAFGCYGGLDAMPEQAEGGDGHDGEGDEGEPEPAPLGCDGAAFDPGPARLRRLTHAEYARSVRDTLGVDPAAEVALFPADVTTGSFDNDSANQTVSVLVSSGDAATPAPSISHAQRSCRYRPPTRTFTDSPRRPPAGKTYIVTGWSARHVAASSSRVGCAHPKAESILEYGNSLPFSPFGFWQIIAVFLSIDRKRRKRQ